MNHLEPYSVVQETGLAGKPVKLNLDYLNERIIVSSYHRENIDLLINHLNKYASHGLFGKIIIVAHEEDWRFFLAKGYILEGVNSGYYLGRPGYYLVKFLKRTRSISTFLAEDNNILHDVIQRHVDPLPPALPSGFILRDALQEDKCQLAILYGKVFSTYPSPITESGYLSQVINKNLFKVILHEDKIVSAASAEINRANMAAELTDCACLPDYNGKGLMSNLIYNLEQELIQCGFKNLYSIARARSRGINTIFRKLGYAYGGRFINNCTICGQFENMNLWVKNV